MRGHEYVKASLASYLETAVPVRLGMLRTDLDVDTPTDPAAYSIADTLALSTEYPVVLVRSTSAPSITAEAPRVEAQTGSYVVRYEIEVVAACDSSTHGSYEAACVDRDRLLLALRESLLSAGSIADDMAVVTRGMTEQTGAAAETLRGSPLAAGSITLTAAVYEQLVPAPWSGEWIDNVDETVTVFDASEEIT